MYIGPHCCTLIQIPPPFKPKVESDTDTRYFDQQFTGENVSLTPPKSGGGSSHLGLPRLDEEVPYFESFSYRGSLNNSFASGQMDIDIS